MATGTELSPREIYEQASPAVAMGMDELISDRAKAEADLDSMMSEMRGRMKER